MAIYMAYGHMISRCNDLIVIFEVILLLLKSKFSVKIEFI